MTQYGICHTFNSGKNNRSKVSYRGGVSRGLAIMLNVSQSDYTLGNKIAQGFSISIHGQGESFNAFDEAFSVMPGTYATISLSEQRVGLVYVFLDLMFFAFRRFNKIRKSGITLS